MVKPISPVSKQEMYFGKKKIAMMRFSDERVWRREGKSRRKGIKFGFGVFKTKYVASPNIIIVFILITPSATFTPLKKPVKSGAINTAKHFLI